MYINQKESMMSQNEVKQNIESLSKYHHFTDTIKVISSHMADFKKPKRAFPYFASKVQAGFPSPADDYLESQLDLNEHLIKHPSATFFLTAQGSSMSGAGIQSGDLLVVDKSLDATHGSIVIAAVNGELTVKKLVKRNGRLQLVPENKAYPAIDITEHHELVIWGVVTHVIHKTQR